MDTIFVAPGREFHPDQGVEGHEPEIACVFAFFNGCVRLWLIGKGALGGEDDVDGIAHFALFAIQKDFHAFRIAERGYMAVHKTCRGKSNCGCRQIFTPQQDVDITGIAHCGFIHSGDPCGYSVAADYGIGNLSRIQCG